MNDLLLWCVRHAVLADGAGPPPPTSDFGDDDWGAFIAQASRHSVIPLAWRALENVDGVPNALLEELRTAFDANAVRNLRLAGELVAASRALAQAGIESVTWKGPLLAERAYGDLRLRQFFDLDLLVRPADLTAAVDVMAGLGFMTQLSLDPRQQAAYVSHMGELELVRDSDGLWLELHTAVVPTYFGHGRGAEDLWRRLQIARVARAEVPALDPADELEALCVHGSKHLWERLEWIVDICMLGRLLTTDEWQRLAAGAAQRGTSRMVDAALALAVAMCGARFPDQVMAQVRADRPALRLAVLARNGLMRSTTDGRLAELRFHVQMWDRPVDRARYLANVVLTPSVADWQFVALPPALEPLYPLVRPVRMLREALHSDSPGEPVRDAHGHR